MPKDPHVLTGLMYHESRAKDLRKLADDAEAAAGRASDSDEEAELLEEATSLRRSAEVEVEQGEYLYLKVQIKRGRSFAMQRRLREAQIDRDSGQINMYEGFMAKLDECILDWNLKDEDGNAIPANREGYESDEFPEGLGEWLVEAIEDYYMSRRRPIAERKELTGSSKPSSELPVSSPELSPATTSI